MGYLKSKGSQHTWWGALTAGDFKRVKEYVDNGQDVNEINPVLWNGNSTYIAHEWGLGYLILLNTQSMVINSCTNPPAISLPPMLLTSLLAFHYSFRRLITPDLITHPC